MNNISPLSGTVNDARLSRPEASAPDASEAQLHARRAKLRRIVAWVVGGAALLMCAGLVRGAIRSHSQPNAVEAAVAAAAPPSAATTAAQAPDPSVASAVAPAAPAAAGDQPLAAKSSKKIGAAHLGKAHHPAAKVSVARH